MLGMTASWTAAVRARESAREGALFRDPYAAALAGETGSSWIAGRTDDSVLPIVLRTRYFDDWLVAALASGIDQVVVPGAGLDARPYRLPVQADADWYELDTDAILEAKQRTLDDAGAVPRCRRIPVVADLADAWTEALQEAGFDSDRPSVWLLEGILFYLPPETLLEVLEQAGILAAPGSRLGFDIVNAAVLTSPWTRPWVEMQAAEGAPWLGTMEDPVGVLEGLGWRGRITQAGQPDAAYGRWTLPVLPVDMPDVPHSWLVTAARMG